tara:strand:- start:2002 stop:2637 length:636 start_codon:yes stop_codon:yes gene_type:complete
MNKSESISNLAKALCKAQNEMGGAVKDATNPFFKSKYADLGSVIKAIKEPFYSNGLSYSQFPVTSAGGQGIGVTTILMHSSGEWLESEFCLPLAKLDPQAGGAAITYARRYSLMSAAGIPSADCDSEAAMMRGKPVEKPRDELCEEAVTKHIDSLQYIRRMLIDPTDDNVALAKEAFGEIPEEDQRAMWVAPSKCETAFLTTEERKLLKGA